MFGKGKKEKDVLKMVESLSAEEKQDLIEALMPQESQAQEQPLQQPQQETQQETSTNEKEKVVEVAKTTDDTNQDVSNNETPNQEQDNGGNGISIDDVMLKSEFQKYVESFEAKFNSVIKENQDLKNQKAELEAKNNEYREKYENNSFGNYKDNSTNDNNKSNNYESASDYFSKFFNK